MIILSENHVTKDLFQDIVLTALEKDGWTMGSLQFCNAIGR